MDNSKLIGITVSISDITHNVHGYDPHGVCVSAIRGAMKKGRLHGEAGSLSAYEVFDYLLGRYGLDDFHRQRVIYWGEVLTGERDVIPESHRAKTEQELKEIARLEALSKRTPQDDYTDANATYSKAFEEYNASITHRNEIQQAADKLEKYILDTQDRSDPINVAYHKIDLNDLKSKLVQAEKRIDQLKAVSDQKLVLKNEADAKLDAWRKSHDQPQEQSEHDVNAIVAEINSTRKQNLPPPQAESRKRR